MVGRYRKNFVEGVETRDKKAGFLKKEKEVDKSEKIKRLS